MRPPVERWTVDYLPGTISLPYAETLIMVEHQGRKILQLLKTGFIGRNLLYYPVIPSTMDTARQLACDGAPEGTIVIAETQSQGRGRLGRKWLTPPGTLAMSVILRPESEVLPQLVMITALAVVRTIREDCSLDPKIKWPNDVLINGKKVCGILTESEMTGGKVSFVIVGIGLNINMDPSAYPEIATTATSLSEQVGRVLPFDKITADLLGNLEDYYLRLRAGERFTLEWRQNLDTIGKKITVLSGTTVVTGTADDVTDQGELIIRRPDGVVETVLAGDVTSAAA